MVVPFLRIKCNDKIVNDWLFTYKKKMIFNVKQLYLIFEKLQDLT